MDLDMLPLAATTADGRWAPGIGDPTPMGWVTVAAYFLAALACVLSARAEQRAPRIDPDLPADPIFWRPGRSTASSTPRRSTGPAFWWLLALVMVGLGVNKQLDLQSLVTQVGRSLARSQGWYEGRAAVQRAFILAVAAGGLAGLAAFCWIFRRAVARRPLAIGGLFFLLAFVTVRAASFHHVDAFIGSRISGVKWNWILELGGIAMIAASAVAHLRSLRTPAPDDSTGARRYRVPGR